MELQILGSNSAAFAHNRHHTSQLLRVQDKYFLIDCGEGTQLLIKRYKIRLSRINHILISHLHGDHYYGLMGLISTLHLYGRQSSLDVYGPPGLPEIISLQLKYSGTRLSYDINYHEWIPEQEQVIYDDSRLSITTIPLEHRIPCCGYLFREKPKKRGINKHMILEKLPPAHINLLRNGEDLLDEAGNVRYKSELVTLPPKKPFSYAYCSDTRYLDTLFEKLKDADLIYHESTFMDDMKDRAVSTFHSTASQAATLAKNANAGRLLLGHFSTRYKDLNPMLREARAIFPNTELAEEGKKFIIK